MIGQVTDGIEGLLGRPCSDNDFFALHGLVHEGNLPLDPLAEDFGLGKLAAACVAAGQIAAGGVDDGKAVLSQQADIVLGDGILQHRCIHGGSCQFFAFGCQNNCREHVVGDPVCHPGNNIRSGGGDQNEIRLFCHRDMPDVKLKFPVKGIDHAFGAGQCLKGQRRDKFRRVFCHDHMYFGACLVERTGDICHFVGGDPAGDS